MQDFIPFIEQQEGKRYKTQDERDTVAYRLI